MSRILGGLLTLAVIAFFAYPFAHEAYHRYQVHSRLDALMDERDRAAFHDWNGNAVSFGQALFDRCERVNGANAAACEPYRRAIQ
jgi:hypothetical protein